MSTMDLPYAQPAQQEPKRKRRIFLWFFLTVQLLFVVWIVGGASQASGGPTGDCGSLSTAVCNDAQDIGTGIGVVMLVMLWMVVDFLLGVIYGVYRLAKRT